MHIRCHSVQIHLPPWFLVLFHEFICKCGSVPPLYVNNRQNGSNHSFSLLDVISTILGVIALPFKHLFKYVKYFAFLLISLNQYNINSPWPYTAKSIDSQLTQLFSHMLIQALPTTWCKTSSQLGHMFEFSDFVNFQSLLLKRYKYLNKYLLIPVTVYWFGVNFTIFS